MEWDDAMSVLEGWAGRHVVVIPYLEPGISLSPVRGSLTLERPRPGVVKFGFPGMGIALRRATFIDADWVLGQEGQGLAVVQGGARVDVFLDPDAA